MNNMLDIWQSRLQEHIKETRTYMKYMLNDHLVIVLIFFSSGRCKLVQQMDTGHSRSLSVLLGDGRAVFARVDKLLCANAFEGG